MIITYRELIKVAINSILVLVIVITIDITITPMKQYFHISPFFFSDFVSRQHILDP